MSAAIAAKRCVCPEKLGFLKHADSINIVVMAIDFGSKPFKSNDKDLYSILADLFLLFSNSTPWLILYSLRRKGMTLSEISKKLEMTPKLVLPGLMALQKKNILTSYSRSQMTYYRLSNKRIFQAFDLIHEISQKKVLQAETERAARKTLHIPKMSRQKMDVL